MHYDVRYVLIAPEAAKIRMSPESNKLRWFTPGEMKGCSLDAGLRRLIEKWQALLAHRRKWGVMGQR